MFYDMLRCVLCHNIIVNFLKFNNKISHKFLSFSQFCLQFCVFGVSQLLSKYERNEAETMKFEILCCMEKYCNTR